jgi:hypothetical protein
MVAKATTVDVGSNHKTLSSPSTEAVRRSGLRQFAMTSASKARRPGVRSKVDVGFFHAGSAALEASDLIHTCSQ